MSLRKPNFDDDLGDLIRETLRSQIDAPEPPETIWQQISGALSTNEASPRHRRRILLPAPVIQAAFILLLFIIGGYGLRATYVSIEAQPTLAAGLPQSETEPYVEEYTVPLIVEMPNDELELHMLKTYLRLRRGDGGDLNYYPVALMPTDVIPHPMSPAGRLLNAETSESAFRIDNRLLNRPSVQQMR